MQNILIQKKWILLLILAIGIFFRFYNLNWGSPFYFHPDERNISSSVTQLNFPQMNPHFFAYGSLPIYAIYFTGVVINYIQSIFFYQIPIINQITRISFENSLIISRLFSAALSVILLLLIYKTATMLKGRNAGIIALIFSATSTGFIQFAHFGTFETWLALLSTLLFYFLLKFIKNRKNIYYLLSIFTLGILISVKISSLVLTPLPLLALIFYHSKSNIHPSLILRNLLFSVLLLVVIPLICFFVFSPYSILDYKSFTSSIFYESSVAIGTMHVFYTDGFYNTMPILFQFTKIYPFLINPVLTILFLPILIVFTYKTLVKKDFEQLLLLAFFFIIFFSQVFLFAKWTRYMLPTLPFIYLIISVEISSLIKSKNLSLVRYLILIVIFFASFIYCLSFFITNYIHKDTRISAVEFVKQNLPKNSKVLSEVYDMGIVPLNSHFYNINLFNFYDLDNSLYKEKELYANLNNYDYIILPSTRILRSRFLNPSIFPKGYSFYKNLISGKNGYKMIYVTPCDIFCKIVYVNNPVFGLEETVYVFDRPTIYIFKKQ
ncbi:MAG: hypothetical protein A2857_00870 [Candidatus Levybacteria bacterium RIFCSPHIGHO2_01_FULL_36_15]|nr:MAG: hypothetical protein A2857_00870 [Candidatus Levybacteria bacterium RIFCSPHIGHO2_01_FULL_36_15]OGH39111.1 MAG: hypothetical protein A2905_06475 [Candidatus Levybacteria bacterium RIFCSPLOWO2_01_FULL_36_10]